MDADPLKRALTHIPHTWAPGETWRGRRSELAIDALHGATQDLADPLQTTVPPSFHTEHGPHRSDLTFEEELGRGGMGVVRLAEQESLGRKVAVKTLLPNRYTAAAADLLVREARVAGRLEHPNILPLHDLRWTEEDGPLLLMKRIEGSSWHELISADGATTDEELERDLRILMEICQAAHFAHVRGVTHRDIKPDNVMVGEYGETYLLDWGIAKVDDDAPTADCILGTPSYMAPEMVLEESTGPHTDVYLLGGCLHHVLTGGPPHPGEHVHAVMKHVLHHDPFTFGPFVPQELADIARKALATDPADRFRSARDLRDALVRFLSHRSSRLAARRAHEQLDGLRELLATDADAIAIHARFSACRFGFEQALSEWSDNTEARDGLLDALQLMARAELDAGNARTAAALLADIPDPPPQLLERLEEVRAHEAARASAVGALQQLMEDSKVEGSDWGRSAVTIVSGLLTTGFLALCASQADPMTLSATTNLAVVVFGISMNWIGILMFRRFLLDNFVYVRIMGVMAILGPIFVVHAIGAVVLELDFMATMMMNASALVTSCAVMAVTLDRIFIGSTIHTFLSWGVVIAFPEWCLWTVTVSYALHAIYIAVMVRPTRQVEHRPPTAALRR